MPIDYQRLTYRQLAAELGISHAAARAIAINGGLHMERGFDGRVRITISDSVMRKLRRGDGRRRPAAAEGDKVDSITEARIALSRIARDQAKAEADAIRRQQLAPQLEAERMKAEAYPATKQRPRQTRFDF
ncbi:hypothetical protein FB008_1385 [Sinorhizobium medicae]|uniref:hypothetical protein n=1 Tax=Sinorhizobium medicae TaxID=110321 RepID=UPI0011A4CA40|nr:hypothetical protein [Sinorhizobium medicae]TWA44245.1 hypothetical protein FB008_1385 [Sinorhizobium medicae]